MYSVILPRSACEHQSSPAASPLSSPIRQGYKEEATRHHQQHNQTQAALVAARAAQAHWRLRQPLMLLAHCLECPSQHDSQTPHYPCLHPSVTAYKVTVVGRAQKEAPRSVELATCKSKTSQSGGQWLEIVRSPVGNRINQLLSATTTTLADIYYKRDAIAAARCQTKKRKQPAPAVPTRACKPVVAPPPPPKPPQAHETVRR